MKVFGRIIVLALVLMLLSQPEASVARNCNIVQLRPCLKAIQSSGQPSTQCCDAIKAQKSCLCTYLKNPKLKNLINSPQAKKVAIKCRVPFPKCK